MKTLKYILPLFGLMAAMNANSQMVDYYSSVNYSISVPLGPTADYISETSFRGFSFEFGRFLNDDLSIGFLFQWNVFYEGFPEKTYEFENLRLTGKRYNYVNAFPLMAAGRYYFMPGSAFRPYGGLGMGAYIINKTTDMGLFRDTNKNWHFGLAPEAGFLLEMGREAFFNLGARYNYAFKSGGDSHSWLGFQAGVTFIY
jgi:opacity protein-like surface antigen